jgi:hypothetical protein
MNIKKAFFIIFYSIFFSLLLPIGSMASISILGGLCRDITIKNSGTGEINQGIIVVKNNGKEPQEVKVYQTDYKFLADGNQFYDEPGQFPNSNASWVSFTPRQLTVPPNGTSNINYSIKVPNNEKLTGTYWSMLMIEVISKNPNQDATQEKGKLLTLGFKSAVRYGIQMVTNIGETGTHNLKFLATRLAKEAKKTNFEVDIENTGERWLRPLIWAELYNQSGSCIGKFSGGSMRLYPGTSGRFRVDLSEVPEGKYKVLVGADCGENDIFGATYDLDFINVNDSSK